MYPFGSITFSSLTSLLSFLSFAEKFSKEGLARTLVFQYATDLAHLAYHSAALADVPRVFVAGNMCNGDVIRGEFIRNLIIKGLVRMTKVSIYLIRQTMRKHYLMLVDLERKWKSNDTTP